MARKYRPARREGEPVSPAIAPVPAEGKTPRGRGKRLTLADRYLILELHRKNPETPYTEIARLTGVHKETARLTILAASRSVVDLMAGYAAPMLDQWIAASTQASARGDHRPAKEWLMHAGIIDPLPDAGKGNGPAVVIINAPMPGMPGYVPEVRGTGYEVRSLDASQVMHQNRAIGAPGDRQGDQPTDQNPGDPEAFPLDKRTTEPE